MSIEPVMPSNHPILCLPLLFSPSIFPSIRVFSSESAVHIRWPGLLTKSSLNLGKGLHLPLFSGKTHPELILNTECFSKCLKTVGESFEQGQTNNHLFLFILPSPVSPLGVLSPSQGQSWPNLSLESTAVLCWCWDPTEKQWWSWPGGVMETGTNRPHAQQGDWTESPNSLAQKSAWKLWLPQNPPSSQPPLWMHLAQRQESGKEISLVEGGTTKSFKPGEKAELTAVWPRWVLSLYLGNSKINMTGMMVSDSWANKDKKRNHKTSGRKGFYHRKTYFYRSLHQSALWNLPEL